MEIKIPRVAEQTSLFGFEPPQATDRLFYAVFPPPEIAAQAQKIAADLRVRNGLGGPVPSAGRLHVTINHIDDYAGLPKSIVDAAIRAGDAVVATAFDLRFDYAASFGGRPGHSPLVLRNDQPPADLMAFQQSLALGMMRAGLGAKAEKTFTPHMTLLYDRSPIAKQAIDAIGWTASEFVLVHSLLGRTQHIPLARWTLAAKP